MQNYPLFFKLVNFRQRVFSLLQSLDLFLALGLPAMIRTLLPEPLNETPDFARYDLEDEDGEGGGAGEAVDGEDEADLPGLEGLRLAGLVLGEAAHKLLDEDVEAAVLDEVHDAC